MGEDASIEFGPELKVLGLYSLAGRSVFEITDLVNDYGRLREITGEMAGIKSRLDKPKLSKKLVKASLFCAQTPPSPGSRKLMKNQPILFTVVLLAFGS